MEIIGNVNGAMIASFLRACINHKILLKDDFSKIISDDESQMVGRWYPITTYLDLCKKVSNKFENSNPILNKVGEEMMNLWYNFGPGKEKTASAVEFLKYQTGSEGYHSMVKGDSKVVGDFSLEYINEKNGIALISSSTPLNRAVEAGVLRGGVKLFSSTHFSKVTQSEDKNSFLIEFKSY